MGLLSARNRGKVVWCNTRSVGGRNELWEKATVELGLCVAPMAKGVGLPHVNKLHVGWEHLVQGCTNSSESTSSSEASLQYKQVFTEVFMF